MRELRVVEPVPGPALYDALRSALDGGPPVGFAPGVVDDEVCLVLPTSGSTGEPKLVELTPSCLRASDVLGEGRWWLQLPVDRVGGLQVVIRSGFAPSLDADGCDFTSLVPTQLLRMLDDPRLPQLRAVLLGGAAAAPSLLAAARERGINVITTYGMTETGGGCVYDGSPLPSVSVDVSDRIVISGPVVARGYVGGPAFAGSFTTSDVGRWVDGRLEVLGRADDVINTGGVKVAPLPVEQALLDHPSVREVAVVGVPDPEWGSRVVAFAVLSGPLPLEEAREWVAARLGKPSAPRELRVLDALPLLPGGKVDRLRLAAS